MPIVYDHINTSDKYRVDWIHFTFNEQEVRGFINQPLGCIYYRYEHVGGSAGVSTMVTINLRDYLVEDYFISVVCKDVEAFVRHQTKKLIQFSLTILDTDGNQKTIETNINRMCQCLEKSLQSRTEKLKVVNFDLSVLEISQAVSAVNLLDREILRMVTVYLPFENSVFSADDFIPLIEGRQRFNLRIELLEFSLQVLEEVKKLLNYTSQFNCIDINYKTFDEKCIELIPGAYHWPDLKNVTFRIDHADDPIEEMAIINLLDNKCHLNIFEVPSDFWFRIPDSENQKMSFRTTLINLSDKESHLNIFEIPSIMRSIASNLEFSKIQSLRKVSRGIRQCVDYVKPEPHIISYFIALWDPFAIVYIHGMMSEGIKTLYRGSLEQRAARIANDFDLNTRHQKSCMDSLCVKMDEESWKLEKEYDSALSKFFKLLRNVLIWNLNEEDDSALSKFFKLLRKVLISRKSPLKVKQLELVTHWQCLVMNILPYLDAEYLECIIILMFKTDEEYAIDLDEISKTEQWSKAKYLCISLTVRMSIQDMNILMFERIFITLETMSQEDITYCRKNLPQSPVFKKFKIRIKNYSTENFLAALGEPYRVVNDIKYIWYFRIEKTRKYLHVVLAQIPLKTDACLQFIKVHQNKTPFFKIS